MHHCRHLLFSSILQGWLPRLIPSSKTDKQAKQNKNFFSYVCKLRTGCLLIQINLPTKISASAKTRRFFRKRVLFHQNLVTDFQGFSVTEERLFRKSPIGMLMTNNHWVAAAAGMYHLWRSRSAVPLPVCTAIRSVHLVVKRVISSKPQHQRPSLAVTCLYLQTSVVRC